MKVAIVVDDLIQRGGQEKLFEAVLEIWPEATVFTSVASSSWLDKLKVAGHSVVTSFVQKIPFAIKLNRYLAPFFIYNAAFERFDFSGYNIVISISSRFAHNIITKPGTLHICYMNSPGRMFWEFKDYFKNETYGFLQPIKLLARPFLSVPLQVLRIENYISAKRVDYFIANSENIKKEIKKYYQRNSLVIHPFYEVLPQSGPFTERSSDRYFLVISRLVPWKRVDIAVKACTALGLKLKVLGVGPDTSRLKRLAGDTVEFLGYAEEKKTQLLMGCQALIQTQEEDFGIVPLEAMSLGKPVIAFGMGGVLETVVEGKTGVFFHAQSANELIKLLRDFSAENFSSRVCTEQAQKFSKNKFQTLLKDFVETTYNKLYLRS